MGSIDPTSSEIIESDQLIQNWIASIDRIELDRSINLGSSRIDGVGSVDSEFSQIDRFGTESGSIDR